MYFDLLALNKQFQELPKKKISGREKSGILEGLTHKSDFRTEKYHQKGKKLADGFS